MKLKFQSSGIVPMNWGKEKFDYISITVFHNKEKIASAGFKVTDKSLLALDRTEVYPGYERQGIASAMYHWAEEITGLTVRPSRDRTYDAILFWKKWRKKSDGKDKGWEFKILKVSKKRTQ